MLTVWSVCWGDKYSDYHVQRLQQSVRENLDMPHNFVCVTDRDIGGVACRPPWSDLPGWWGKLDLFRVATEFNLFFDLDVVIAGDITDMVNAHVDDALAMPMNWAQSGHGGCQSSVMFWRQHSQNLRIRRRFPEDAAHWPPVNKPGVWWGDQEYITSLRDEGRIEVASISADWIRSYKYHVRGKGLPDDCRVVVFHGDPKPESVSESWFRW